MRTSDCHLELTPSRWPTEGMISALAGGAALLPGLVGGRRLMETGTLAVGTALAGLAPDPLPMVTTTVPVIVPFGRSVGSAKTCNVTPDGDSEPFAGCTPSHGLSTVAVKGK